MSFSYAVPLSSFQRLHQGVDRRLHPEFNERLRTEIHAELGRRVAGAQISTITREVQTSFDSAIVSDDILFYSQGDLAADDQRNPTPLSTAAGRPGLFQEPRGSLTGRTWRYPGDAGGGVFAASVNAVLAQAHVLVGEFRTRSRNLRGEK